MKLGFMLTLFFALLKLFKVISCSWDFVLLPLTIGLLITIVTGGLEELTKEL